MEQGTVRPTLHPLISGPDIEIMFDPATEYLVGWPGYRTRCGRSGLDLIDSQNEFAHMLGLSTRWLLTGRFRTRNPFHLFMMVVVSLVGISPLLFTGASILLD